MLSLITARVCLCVDHEKKIIFCKHLPMNQLINVKISLFSPKLHVWINIIVRKVAQKSEELITVWTMWRLKTLLMLQVWQRIKIMKQTQDRMADSVLRLRLQIFSTSIKPLNPRQRHVRTKLCWFALEGFSCTLCSEDSSNNIAS